jgi:hypothetical protein
VSVLVLVMAVCALTAADRSGAIPSDSLAASPHAISQGRLWLLVSSGLLVQRPTGLSLIAFAALAALTLLLCGPGALWFAAALGHVCSTLLVYSMIGLARLVDHHAFDRVVAAPDYGVSAISAAWLAMLAYQGWRRRDQTPAGRARIVLACVAVALFAWSLRPGLTVLDLEYVIAFCLGVVTVALRVRDFQPRDGSQASPT